MKVKITGNCDAAKMLRGYLTNASTVAVVDSLHDLGVRLEVAQFAAIEGSGGDLENAIAKELVELFGGVSIHRSNTGHADGLKVSVPQERQFDGARAVFRALTRAVPVEMPKAEELKPEPAKVETKPEPKAWWKLWLVLFVLLPARLYAQGNPTLGQKASAGSVPVVQASDYYETEPHTTGTLSAVCNDPCKTSQVTANSVVKLDMHSFPATVVDITSGSITATILGESSIDDENWIALTCLGGAIPIPRGSIVNPASYTSFICNVWPGSRYFRVRVQAYTSGSIGVTVHSSRVSDYNVLLPVSSWPAISGSPTEVPQRAIRLGVGDATTSCNSNQCMLGLQGGTAPGSNTATALYTREIAEKNEDVAANGGEALMTVGGVRFDGGSTQQTSANTDYGTITIDAYGAQWVRPGHPNRFQCAAFASTATTLTALGGGCVAPGASLSLYVTDISFDSSVISTTTTDQLSELKFGTGGSCGTGTNTIYTAYHAAAFTHVSDHFTTPIKILANNELCWMNAAAGTKNVLVTGFIAP